MNSQQIDDLLASARKIKNTDPTQGLKIFQQARQLSEQSGDHKRLADSLLESGWCHFFLSEFQTALEEYSRAAEFYHQLGDTAGEAEAVNEAGVCLGEMGENSTALFKQLQSLALWEKIDQPGGLARCLSSIGNRYYYFGQYDLAFENYQKSLAIREAIADLLGMAGAYNNHAIILDKFGDYTLAADYYQKSVRIYEEIGNTFDLANTLLNLGGMLHECLHQPEAAREALERAHQLIEGSNKLLEALCLQTLGSIFREQGDFSRAEGHFQNSLRLMAEIGSNQMEAEVLDDLAKNQIAQGNPDSALLSLTRALELLSKSDANETIFHIHKSLSEVYEQKNDATSALLHYKEFHRVHEAVFNTQTELKVKGLLIKSETEKARQEAEIHRLKHEELSQANRDLQIALGQNEELYRELQLKADDLLKQVWEDALTKVHNRRYLERRLADETDRARRFGHDLTIVIADIDNFKSINDQTSHPVGDQVLKTIARLLSASCRTVDIICRYGGDEFLLLLLETSIEQAVQTCERMRQVVLLYDWKSIHPELRVTLSIGLCSLKTIPEGTSLVDNADANLYRAKRGGRNRVVGPE